MSGSYAIEYKGKRIVHLDFSNADLIKVLQDIKDGEPLIRNQPEGSVLVLLDITGSSFNKEVTSALKEFAAGNKKYVKMTAVVGVEGIKKVIMDGVLLFTGRKNMVAKNSLIEAKEFLITL